MFRKHEKRPTGITPASEYLLFASVDSGPSVLLLLVSSLSLRRGCFRGCFRRLLLAITPVKTVNASRSVNQFLLAGKERMARRADFHVQVVFSRRAGLESVPTSAGNSDLVIFRMNSWFHFFWPSCPYRCLSTSLLQRVMIRGQSSEVKFAPDAWLLRDQPDVARRTLLTTSKVHVTKPCPSLISIRAPIAKCSRQATSLSAF